MFVVLKGLACGFLQGLIPKEVCESFIELSLFTYDPRQFMLVRFVLEN